MRASIIAWSAFSGALLGLFLDALVIGVWVIVEGLFPSLALRAPIRLGHPLVLALLVTIPALGALLGFMEGRLKV